MWQSERKIIIMVSLQIKIKNRSYLLRTDENQERISKLANTLEEKINEFANSMGRRSEVEILTMVAFHLWEKLDKAKIEIENLEGDIQKAEYETKDTHESAVKEMEQIFALKEKENNELRERITEFEKHWDSHSTKMYGSASDELAQLAKLKDQEMSELQNKLMKYEENWNTWVNQNRDDANEEFVSIAATKERTQNELISKLIEHEKVWDSHAMDVYNSAIREANEVATLKEEENQKLAETLENFEKTFAEFSSRKEDEIRKMQEELESLKLKLADATDGQLVLA